MPTTAIARHQRYCLRGIDEIPVRSNDHAERMAFDPRRVSILEAVGFATVVLSVAALVVLFFTL
jgi:hypothetical protein